jgi:O-antigen/teichoic acid export membrane protein
VTFGFRLLFGAGTTGQMSISSRISRAPAGLTGQALSQVYYRRANEVEKRNGDLRRDIVRGARLVFLIALVPSVALAATASWLMPLVLGQGWRDAGIYTAILAPAMLSMLVVSPFSFVPHVKGVVNIALRFALADLALKAAIIGAGSIIRNPVLVVALLSLETTIANLVVLGWYLRIAGTRRVAA